MTTAIATITHRTSAIGEAELTALDAVSPKLILARVSLIQQVMRDVMIDGTHYGVIPGCDKPSLYKPGADVLGLTFGLIPEFEITRTDLGNGHREIEVVARVKRRNGEYAGAGVGSAATTETKYRYRGQLVEPTGQQVPREYWDVKKADQRKAQVMLGGAGYIAKKVDGAWMIFRSTGEKQENPDIADVYNTVLKIAKKRAWVDAIITVTACSDIFAQDLEDQDEEEETAPAKAAAPVSRPPAQKPAAKPAEPPLDEEAAMKVEAAMAETSSREALERELPPMIKRLPASEQPRFREMYEKRWHALKAQEAGQ